MGKKGIGVIVITLMIILIMVFAYSLSEPSGDDSGNTTLTVYTEGPIHLSDIIEDIENASYYEGYDNETLNWMKSLGDKEVFSGNGTFVVMSSADAGKLHSVYATDVIITQDFKCKILEKRSLGNAKYPREVLLVEDVEFLSENIDDIPGGGA